MLCVLSLVTAVCINLYFYQKYKDALNPFGISILIYMIVYGFSTLNLSIYQSEMLLRTHIMSLIPMISIFFIGEYYCNNYRNAIKTDRLPRITRNYRLFMWLIAGISLLAVAYLIMARDVSLSLDLSQSAALNTRKGEISRQVYADAGIIGKFAQIFPYSMVFIAYDYIFNEDNGLLTKVLEIGYCLLCVLYTLFVLASRGTLLLPLLAMLYMLNKKYQFKVKTIALFILLIIFAFNVYMEFRVVKESEVFSGTKVENRGFNAIYNYFALSFNNFDMLVRDGSPYTITEYSLVSFSKMIGIYDKSHIIAKKTSFFNEQLFIYGFYHDLGIIGVIFWPIVIYLFIGKIYVLSKKRNPELILLLAMYGKAMFVLSFGNYFFESISAEIQYYACMLLLFAGYRIAQLPAFSFGKVKFRRKKIRIRLIE